MRPIVLMTVIAACAGWGCAASALSASPPSGDGAALQGYLRGGAEAWRGVLASPPAEGSYAGSLDITAIKHLQKKIPRARWIEAKRDEDEIFPRFAIAFGATIDRSDAPMLIRLLSRAIKDSDAPIADAKLQFPRPRPFQQLRLKNVCSPDRPSLRAGEVRYDSYPSGHSTRGWATALILAQVAPDHAPQLLSRAADYGLSREICGMHFPSDVEAGRAVAISVISRLVANREFENDLACARIEQQRRHGSAIALPQECAIGAGGLRAE